MSEPKLKPRNHDCDPPDPGKEACDALHESDGRASWRCPCGSLWSGKPKFMDGYGNDREYRWRIDWDRVGGSSHRWRRRERKRLRRLTTASESADSCQTTMTQHGRLGAEPAAGFETSRAALRQQDQG